MLTNVHCPFDQRIYHKEAKTLAAAGYGITVVGPGDSMLEGRADGITVKVIPVPRSSRERLTNLWRLFRIARTSDATLVHFHDPELLPVAFLLTLLGKKVIYDVHEHFSVVALTRSWIPRAVRKPLSFAVERGERYLGRYMSAVVGVVDEQGKRFRRRPFVAVKNFPRLECFDLPQGVNGRSCDLLHVGSLSRERGSVLLPQILKTLKATHPTFSLLNVGGFHSSLDEQRFHEDLESFDLCSNVRCIHGFVPYSKLGNLIAAGRVGLIPGIVCPKNLKPFGTHEAIRISGLWCGGGGERSAFHQSALRSQQLGHPGGPG
jgi:glycosyltransferase involved in cell wall biosynthesis